MTRSKFRAQVVAAMAALAFVITGCGSGQPTSAQTTYPSSVTLVGGIQTEPNWWFPVVPTAVCSTSNFGISLLFHPLLWISRADAVEYSRSIAQSVTPSNNDTTYTIQLKHTWQWSNGHPVTAQDVVYSWKLVDASAQPKAPWLSCGVGIGGIANLWQSVVATGPYTVVVKTTKPVNPVWFEINGLAQLVPVPKSQWDHTSNMNAELSWLLKNGNQPTSSRLQVVDGPYKLTKFVNDQYWTFVANPKYSGHKAAVKKLVFTYETSSANVYASLRQGNFSTATLPMSFYKAAHQLKGYRLEHQGYAFGINFIDPNESPKAPAIGGLFSHLWFRQVMQYGINQPQIASYLYRGFATPDYGPVPIQPPNQFYDPHLTVYGYNPQKGLALLRAHGFHLVNGVMQNGNLKLSFNFVYMSGSNTDTHIVELLKADWAKEGVQVNLVAQPFNQLIAGVGQGPLAGKWTMAWWGAGWFYGPDYYPTGGGLFSSTGSANSGGYSNQKMNQLIAATYQPGTPAQEQRRLDAYQQYVSQQLPVLWLPEYVGFGSPVTYAVVKPWLHGVVKWYSPIEGESYNRWTIGP